MALASSPLADTDWLAARLDDPKLRIADASWWFPHEQRDARADFDAAHIPGAVFFDIDAISDPTSALPHMLPAPDSFAKAVGALGIGDDHTVVIYETGAPRSAARAWWMFRIMGHDNVVVLDGGLPKWKAEGRPLADGLRPPSPTPFTARFRPALVRGAADVAAILQDESAQIADARPAPRFRGETPEPRDGLKSGHMPGAASLPANAFYGEDGTLLSPARLTSLFQHAGVDPAKPLVATCGSGITACTIALAAARLGYWDTAIYDGSWAEWGASPDAPIVVGP